MTAKWETGNAFNPGSGRYEAEYHSALIYLEIK